MRHRSSSVDDIMKQIAPESEVAPKKKLDWVFPDLTGEFLALLVGVGFFFIGYERYSYNKAMLDHASEQLKEIQPFIVKVNKDIKNIIADRDTLRLTEEQIIRMQAQIEDRIINMK